MTDPVAAARRAAAERIAAGGYVEADVDLGAEPTERITRERLMRYALVDPDPDLVYSTRGGLAGRTVTALKRLLMRGLRQYHGQLIANQTRFNLFAVAYITALEERLAELEAEREGR